MKTKKLEEMLSEHCYNELKEKVMQYVGKGAFDIIFPAIKKALEEGDGQTRRDILIEWLDMSSCRVCDECGAIMEKGWYLDCMGYACSDECAMKVMEVPDMEHFNRYRIYKADIDFYLEGEGKGRREEDLTQDEVEEILDEICNNIEACYTEWY